MADAPRVEKEWHIVIVGERGEHLASFDTPKELCAAATLAHEEKQGYYAFKGKALEISVVAKTSVTLSHDGDVLNSSDIVKPGA